MKNKIKKKKKLKKKKSKKKIKIKIKNFNTTKNVQMNNHFMNNKGLFYYKVIVFFFIKS